MDLNIRIRIGSANAGDYETKTFTNSTFGEAVAALQGEHVKPEPGDHPESTGYHRRNMVYVVATYKADWTKEATSARTRTVSYKADEPVFGFEATVYGRDVSFGTYKDAEPAWASMGSVTVEEARLQARIIGLAIELADAANAEPACSGCKSEVDRYAARQARIDAEASK
jgi:hypothetical protein